MPREPMQVPCQLVDDRRSPSTGFHLGWLAWGLVLLGICGWLLVKRSPGQGVYPIFGNAARNWCAAIDLYAWHPGSSLDLYRYSPTVAALLVPFGLLPDRLGGVVWRFLNVGVFLTALASWSRLVLPRPLSRTQQAVLFLLVLPLALGSVHNGQSNPLVIGLLMAALAAVTQERWNLASACVTVACLFKVYPIAVGLLLALLYPRRFSGRLAAGLLVGLALPFLLQRPDYVLAEYHNWFHYLSVEDRQTWWLEYWYRDLRLLCRVWLVPLSAPMYLAIQLTMAAASAALCLAGRLAGWPQRRLLTFLLGLGCCWMTVFGPATESCTYILLAPTAAWAVLESGLERPGHWSGGLALAGYGILTLAQFVNWLPGLSRPVHTLAPQPFAGLLLLLGLLAAEIYRRPNPQARPGSTAVPALSRAA